MAKRPEAPEPRIVRIFDGVFAEMQTIRLLPEHLDVTEHQGRITTCFCVPLLRKLRVTRQSYPRVQGSRAQCLDAEHQREHWLSGRAFLAGEDHDLVLTVCIFCWCVEVRDVTATVLLDAAPDGRSRLITKAGSKLRKDFVVGTYSGRRPAGRIYL